MPKAAIAAALSIPALKRRGFSRIWINTICQAMMKCYRFYKKVNGALADYLNI